MVRLGLCGLGGAAERIHLPACRLIREIEVVGACEPLAGTRRRIAARFSIENVYEDTAALIAAQHPDVLIIATPPDTHHSICRQALEAGAHVFCEKPFMTSVEEADEVIALARKSDRCIRVNNQYRYMPLYRKTRERLQGGDFGRLFYLQCWQQMFHPPQHEKVAWRAAQKQATLFEFGTHALDLICYLFDDLPLAVAAQMPRVREDYDSDVLVQLVLRFPDDRLAAVSLNRVSHAPERYLEMRLDCDEASLRLSLGGVARASVEWSRRRGGPTARFSFVKGGEARAESGGRSIAYVKERQSAFMSATADHLRVFLQELLKEPVDHRPIEHAREILRLALSGYESASTGETVWLRPGRRPSGSG